jgi:hypothetical protein
MQNLREQSQFTFIANPRNPMFPPTAFIPDGEPRVFEYKGEMRVFLYGSHSSESKSKTLAGKGCGSHKRGSTSAVFQSVSLSGQRQ